MHALTRFRVLVLGAMLALPLSVAAQPVTVLPRPVPPADQGFGYSLASDGTRLLVGALADTGALGLYDGTTGALLQTFTSPSATAQAFGVSVALVGNTVIVGDSFDGLLSPNGAVHLFDATTGGLLRTIPRPAGGADGFGHSVAALGSKVLVGSLTNISPPPDSGGAYVFDAATGSLLLEFTPPGGSYFGSAVAALGADVLVREPTAAYLYDGSSGVLLRTFSVGGAGAVTAFGNDVLLGNTKDEIVELFDAATGVLLQTFTPPPGEPADGFGSSLAVMGSNVLVGADGGGVGVGAAYLFDGATGVLLRTLRNPTPEGSDFFGGRNGAVAAVGDSIFVGAYGDESPAPPPGSVYRFCGGAMGCGPCETCGPGGTCVEAPHPVCRAPTEPGKSILRAIDREPDRRDRVVWKWRGETPGDEEFGDPLAATDYTLCLWDESGLAPELVFRAGAPAGGDCAGRPCWKRSPTVQTVGYRDRDKTPEGVKFIRLRATAISEARLVMRAVGEHLSGRPLGLPFTPVGLPLRAQLQGRDGLCWEAAYSVPTVNTAERFVAKSD